MDVDRRSLLLAAGAATLAPGLPRAEPVWPAQPIKLVVPYPPGGMTDVLDRPIGDTPRSAFGQTVIIDNKPGAARQYTISWSN